MTAVEELRNLKTKIEKMKETYKGAQDYEYENYKKYNEEGNAVAAIELLANPMHLKRSMRISKICKKPTDNCNYQSAGGKESLRLSASIVTKTGGLHKWHTQIATWFYR